MAIVFKHAVKYAGKYYPPNTPIQEIAGVAQSAESTKVKADVPEKGTVAQKAVRGRRKGDV